MNANRNHIRDFKRINADYLTFYHELRTPLHDFFSGPGNHDEQTRLLMISSPSRMGNHLLLSILDNHPQLPRIPGEDGFLSFSFWQANYDLNRYLEHVRDRRDIAYIKRLSTNLFFDKWANLKQCYLQKNIPKTYSGVNIIDRPADIDFKDTIYDVDYDTYNTTLSEGLKSIAPDSLFRDYLNLYTKALLKLDPARADNVAGVDGYISYSGMRSQVRWVLDHYRQARLITSVRPFETYAISHIKSRNRDNAISDEGVQEAWEHWYHKTIDYFYLKATYPDQVCLVSFEDLTEHSEQVARGICHFLGIDFNGTMLTPSIFGIPVKGNPSQKQSGTPRGTFYKSEAKLEPERIPEDYFHLWKSFDLVKTI